MWRFLFTAENADEKYFHYVYIWFLISLWIYCANCWARTMNMCTFYNVTTYEPWWNPIFSTCVYLHIDDDNTTCRKCSVCFSVSEIKFPVHRASIPLDPYWKYRKRMPRNTKTTSVFWLNSRKGSKSNASNVASESKMCRFCC